MGEEREIYTIYIIHKDVDAETTVYFFAEDVGTDTIVYHKCTSVPKMLVQTLMCTTSVPLCQRCWYRHYCVPQVYFCAKDVGTNTIVYHKCTSMPLQQLLQSPVSVLCIYKVSRMYIYAFIETIDN